MKAHDYHTHIVWNGNLGEGTKNWTTYGRQYDVRVQGKPTLSGSAHPSFRGDGGLHDPEDLFLAAVASCHMLAYLALCAREHIRVVAYEDQASGVLALNPGGGGRFASITLRPEVTIAEGSAERAAELHERAHELCFIASSSSVPITNEPLIRVEVGR